MSDDAAFLALFVKGVLALHPDLDPDGDAVAALDALESQNQALQERIKELEGELAERSRIIDTLHLRSMSNTIQDGDALQERAKKAEAALRRIEDIARPGCTGVHGYEFSAIVREVRALSPTKENA